MKKNISIIITLIFLVFMAVLIFAFSAQTSDASSSISRAVTRFLLSVFSPGFNDLDPVEQLKLIAASHGLVRKLAHFTEYAVLRRPLSALKAYTKNEGGAYLPYGFHTWGLLRRYGRVAPVLRLRQSHADQRHVYRFRRRGFRNCRSRLCYLYCTPNKNET